MGRRKILRNGLVRLRLVRGRNQERDISIKKAGLPPGTLVYIGKRKNEVFHLEAFDYNKEDISESIITSISECEKFKNNGRNTWINAIGLDRLDEVQELGTLFGLDNLLLEDLVNTQHRTKLEFFDDFLYINIKMISLKKMDEHLDIDVEQVSLILGKDWLLTFQEEAGDVFNNLRVRLKDPVTQLRNGNIDYLFYRIIDTVVDHYFKITEYISDKIENLEDEIVMSPKDDVRIQMQLLRKDIILLRKAVLPLREAMASLSKEDNKFVKKSTMRYFNDIHDHVIQLHEYIDTQRDMLSSLGDLYLSGVSFKMNQIMKVLTIISTIFIPLTFIAGIYGMNFENMPELSWPYGYPVSLGVMALIVIGMLIYFRRKDWI